MKWEVIDSYGAVVHTASTLTAAGVWIDPVLGIDFTGKAWGKRKNGESIDADRFVKNDDGSYTIQMYEGGGGIGGELTVRKQLPECVTCGKRLRRHRSGVLLAVGGDEFCIDGNMHVIPPKEAK